MDPSELSPEELQALERSIEALRRFPHLRRAMIEALQMDELFALPGQFEELKRVVLQILERLIRVEQIASEAKQEAQEAKREAQEAKQIALEVRERVDKVEKRLARVERDVAELKGDSEELKARRRLPAVLGRYFKKMRIYDAEQLYPLIGETLVLDEEDAVELLYADLFVYAQSKVSQQEYWLVVEVSWGVGVKDVERAHQRAAILQKHGYPALGVAMGRTVTREAERRAGELGVLIAKDGTLRGAALPS
ncbi:MAG: hypothetical protein NZ874_02375 [Fimbriimonadales bacterium]|nr:hypothetical protein [Fimbriimonadales bacterium]